MLHNGICQGDSQLFLFLSELLNNEDNDKCQILFNDPKGSRSVHTKYI